MSPKDLIRLIIVVSLVALILAQASLYSASVMPPDQPTLALFCLSLLASLATLISPLIPCAILSASPRNQKKLALHKVFAKSKPYTNLILTRTPKLSKTQQNKNANLVATEKYLSTGGRSPCKNFLMFTYSLIDLNSLNNFLPTAMFSKKSVWSSLTLKALVCLNAVLVALDLVLHKSGPVLNHFAELVPALCDWLV